MKKILFSSIVATTLLFANNSAQININNDTVEVSTDIYLEESNNYYYFGSYLRTSNYGNTNTNSLLTVGIKVLNSYFDNNGGINYGFGIKGVYSNDYKKFFATPLAIFANYTLNENIYFDAQLSYAPRVLSFKDALSYSDYSIKANYKIIENGSIFIGYRNINKEFTNKVEIKYDKSIFAGYKVTF